MSPKCVSPIKYRSSWELAYARYLDANESVVSYSYEPFSIDYVSNVRTRRVRRYWPDFEIVWKTGSRTIVEIKPVKKLTLAKNVKKMMAARAHADSHGVEYRVVTEIDLRGLGLL